MSYDHFRIIPPLRTHTITPPVPAPPKPCKHPDWLRVSSHGQPVLGISRCPKCGKRADLADIRAWRALNLAEVRR